MVKALFQIARQMAPSVIFIGNLFMKIVRIILDEIDSILTERSESEHEASRRLKTEFLLQFDGIGMNDNDRVLVLAATNRPQELDEAALRRFTKRIYIPLPEPATRLSLLKHLLSSHEHTLTSKDFAKLVQQTDGYSCSDLTALAREASLGPIRELGPRLISASEKHITPISHSHFEKALKIIRKSVSPASLNQFEAFHRDYGTAGI
jgi:spastin